MSKQVKNTVAILAFSISKKAQLPAIRITEQSTLLTKSKINRPGYNFSKYFAKNWESNLRRLKLENIRPAVALLKWRDTSL